MAADGSTRAVVTALAANLGIAISKFVAALVTGSSAMLAESVHSVADSANQALLLVGGRRAKRTPSPLHPFGYARERYIYAFLVAIVLFTLGGVYALYEGYAKVTDPHELRSPLVAVAVLLVAIALEGYALRTAVQAADRVRGGQSWVQFIRHARAPELPVILLEDAGALLGLLFALSGIGLTLACSSSPSRPCWPPRSRACSSASPPPARRSTRSTPRCSPNRASTGSSTCAPSTSAPTSYSSPPRSASATTTTAPRSPTRSTTPRHGSAMPSRRPKSSISNPTFTGPKDARLGVTELPIH
jgi:Cation efflux family